MSKAKRQTRNTKKVAPKYAFIQVKTIAGYDGLKDQYFYSTKTHQVYYKDAAGTMKRMHHEVLNNGDRVWRVRNLDGLRVRVYRSDLQALTAK